MSGKRRQQRAQRRHRQRMWLYLYGDESAGRPEEQENPGDEATLAAPLWDKRGVVTV